MPLIDPRLAALGLVLGLLGAGAPGPGSAQPYEAEVVVEELDIFDEPDAQTVASGQLHRGDLVVVQAEEPGGWLAIEPPQGSFDWVEQAAIRRTAGRSTAQVVAARVQVRAGHPEARLPGVPRGTLARGATVQLVDRPPLVWGGKTWRAIAPTAGEVRHVRSVGVDTGADPRRRGGTRSAPVETRADIVPGSHGKTSAPAGSQPLPPPTPAIAHQVAQIEASHRSAVSAPIEQWELTSIRQRYEELLKGVTDSASGKAIRARLEIVEAQAEAAEAARRIDAILERSRRRDRTLALYLRRLAQAGQPHERPYDAEGMIQPSSRKVDGQKVFALIGPEGTAIAYLDIPAGLDVSTLIARQVGVRGSSRFDENLRARLISVRDLDALDDVLSR